MKKIILSMLTLSPCLLIASQSKLPPVSVKQDGNHISIKNELDVICFVSEGERIFPGYTGLTNLEFVNELARKQNYIEMLKYVWSEKDLDKRRKWLQMQAENGHIICMFELSKEYAVIKNQQKSYDWFLLAGYRLAQDSVCCYKEIGSAAFTALGQIYSYQIPLILHLLIRCNDLKNMSAKYVNDKNIKVMKEREFKELKSVLNKAKKLTVEKLENGKNYPSPVWITYHSPYFHLAGKTDALIPMNQWPENRKIIVETLKRNDEWDNSSNLEELANNMKQS